jgi:phenylacetic acid degradation operon negative regulatory protein
VHQRWVAGAGDGGTQTFVDYVDMVTAWRQLPYADPGLPLDLLPADWNAVSAEQLFTDLREILAGPASAHARQVVSAAR